LQSNVRNQVGPVGVRVQRDPVADRISESIANGRHSLGASVLEIVDQTGEPLLDARHQARDGGHGLRGWERTQSRQLGFGHTQALAERG
jgi:hypothetical protein